MEDTLLTSAFMTIPAFDHPRFEGALTEPRTTVRSRPATPLAGSD